MRWYIQLTLWRKDGENMVKVPLYYAGSEYHLKPILTPIKAYATMFRNETRVPTFTRALKAELAQHIPNAYVEFVEAV